MTFDLELHRSIYPKLQRLIEKSSFRLLKGGIFFAWVVACASINLVGSCGYLPFVTKLLQYVVIHGPSAATTFARNDLACFPPPPRHGMPLPLPLHDTRRELHR